ncbi:MAG: MTH1187 family thiamine-binding protein [Candidatus Methanomethyliales bacterium]|nr:MTH1187 family thiamine-binding protein [Candidatus Methanomethylicales archaeon]
MIILEFSVVPVGTGKTGVSEYVAKACKVIEASGVRYMVTPMGTIIETDSLEKAFDVVKRTHETVFEAGAKRVITTIKIDDRRDKDRKMEDKVEKLKEMGVKVEKP